MQKYTKYTVYCIVDETNFLGSISLFKNLIFCKQYLLACCGITIAMTLIMHNINVRLHIENWFICYILDLLLHTVFYLFKYH